MACRPRFTGSRATVVEALGHEADRTRPVSSARSANSATDQQPPRVIQYTHEMARIRAGLGARCPTNSSSTAVYDRTRRDQLREERHHRVTGAGERIERCLFAVFQQHGSVDTLDIHPAHRPIAEPPLGNLLERHNGHLLVPVVAINRSEQCRDRLTPAFDHLNEAIVGMAKKSRDAVLRIILSGLSENFIERRC